MALPAPTIYDPAKHKPLIHQFASIHAACVLRDGTLATFLPARKGAEMTMDHTKLVEYWLSRSQQVEEGSREIILQYADNNEAGVVGVVSLSMPPSETGPFRSLVEKLLVSPDHRYKGIARRLMEKLEEVALDKHRDLVMLDTTIGSGAEHVYRKLGYNSLGVVPKYGIHPLTREMVDEEFFWKDLRSLEA
ncbi:hypothetical protein LTR86_001977 [Recurvomyces mirabilis]|nr:hypothetical protein LTR86_001977 [Recurvomyces mirabilis]